MPPPPSAIFGHLPGTSSLKYCAPNYILNLVIVLLFYYFPGDVLQEGFALAVPQMEGKIFFIELRDY